MNIFIAIILGIVQGLTEFLPVSSSGHLVLLQKVFGIEKPALLFDTMLHAGTLVAVFAVLWRDIWDILKKIIQPLTLFLIIATIPAVIFALAFKKNIEAAFETGKFLGFFFLITAALLCSAEFLSKRAITKKSMNWLDALIIGILQAIALVPGISRSGATISGALSRKLDRGFAAKFSFLLSIPAILGAVVLQAKDLIKGVESANQEISSVIAGTITAALVGYFAIRFLFKIIREKSLWGFAIYTGALGILITLDQFILHIFNWAG
jgi:undecaprenyl-diphosphatase